MTAPIHVYVEDLKKHAGQDVTIKGWLYNRRAKGKIAFLILRDGTGIVQAVAVKAEIGDAAFATCEKLPQESSLIITGGVRADDRSPGGVEIGIKSITAVGEAAADYPIQIQNVVPEVEFLLKNRHLWLRSKKQAALLRVPAEVIKAIREFFDGRGFTLVDSPMLTPAACEGTSTLFPVDYFGDPAFLTQSGQLYAEASAMALGKVYCFGPAFRAEKSKTRKHLTEFWMV